MHIIKIGLTLPEINFPLFCQKDVLKSLISASSAEETSKKVSGVLCAGLEQSIEKA